MRGFPVHINTKQDLENLLKIPEYKKQAKAELERINELKDSKITKCTTQIDQNDPESEWNKIEVVNLYPKWKQLNFKSKKELTNLIAAVEAAPNGKQKGN